jgi:PAS domain S-box-containing protein
MPMEEPEHLRLLATAVECSFNAVIITGPNLAFPGPEIVYANPAFFEMTGYSPEELIGATPRLLQGEETDPEVTRQLRTTLEAGRFWQGSAVNYRKNGTAYWVEWNISPVRDGAGKITHFVSVQRDITEAVDAWKCCQVLLNCLRIVS